MTSVPCVVAATGHRPEKLGTGRRFGDDLHLASLARSFLGLLQPDAVISGMALGWDMIVAEQTLRLRIPLITAIPGSRADQTSAWKYSEVCRYHHIANQAAQEHIIPATVVNAAVYHARDRWMAGRAQVICAMWDGSKSGTGYTCEYAEGLGVPVVNLWSLR